VKCHSLHVSLKDVIASAVSILVLSLGAIISILVLSLGAIITLQMDCFSRAKHNTYLPILSISINRLVQIAIKPHMVFFVWDQ
jgi:hypothetical protein